MKHCRICDTRKPKSDFGKRKASVDGLSARCRSCQSDYDKSRLGCPKRKAMRADYARTKQGIKCSNRAKKSYRDRNPKKYKAHNMVGNAIRDKKLFMEPCQKCGTEIGVNAHHDDYDKPLNVRWLCQYHHKQWHAKNGEGLNAI